MNVFSRALASLPAVRLGDLPFVARLAVGVVWLAVGFLAPDLLTLTVLLAVGVVGLVAASGVPVAGLIRAAAPYVVVAALVGLALVGMSVLRSEPGGVVHAATVAAQLLLLLVVAMLVLLPQDAEDVVAELIVLLRVPPRRAYGLLVAARAVGGMPRDWGDRRRALRRRGAGGTGITGIAGWLASLRFVASMARRRRAALQARVDLAALARASRRQTTYRATEFTIDTLTFTASAMGVAVIALLLGLIWQSR